jgi:hypothetical protein
MNRLLLPLFLTLGLLGSAQANIKLGFSFSPELLSGTDEELFVGSTWTFDISISQTTYNDFDNIGLPYVDIDSVNLTISGSGVAENNGTFAITPENSSAFVAIPSNTTHGYPITELTGWGAATFEFADGVSVDYLNPSGVHVATPNVGDTVSSEHFNGLELNRALDIATGGEFGAVYSIPTGIVVTAISVPEFSNSSLLLGTMSLFFLFCRRRSRCRSNLGQSELIDP